MNPYSEFTCLYTSQKQKKAKTWHDGHLKYFFNNSKVVLYDEKMNVLDRGSALAVGDDLDMDKHLVTVEDLTSEYATNSGDSGTLPKPAAPFPAPIHAAFQARSTVAPQQSKPIGRPLNPYSSAAPTYTPIRPNDGAIAGSAGRSQKYQSSNVGSTSSYSGNVPAPDLKRKKWRAPFAQAELTPPISADSPFDSLDDGAFENWDNSDMLDFDEATPPTPALKNRSGIATEMRATTGPVYIIPSASSFKTGAPTPSSASTSLSREAAPKRRKVGLSRPAGSLPAPAQSSIMAPHRPPSSQLEFPNAARCTNFTGKNSGQLLRRSMSLGSRFSTTNQYRDSMTFLIYEHLQIMVIEIAITMWSIKSSGKSNDGDSQDALYRSRGVHMHSGSTLRRRGDAYTGFPLYRGGAGGGVSMEASAVVQPSAQQGAVLSLCNKEHHSKYSKDDLWVVSQSSRLDAASTFFARSVFYGPSGNDVEVDYLLVAERLK
ncbi:hypothetical protein BGX24_004221 [Mortierella sp. AD032]|nr:hypothetical protein BGX24_004221 [Mortierella sp. AD032]